MEVENREQELLKNILQGNTTALKEFYNTYSGYFTTICFRYIANRDDVKDVLQESFIKIFKSIDKFEYRGNGSLKAWSTRIVVNESLKYLKEKEKLDMMFSIEFLPDTIVDQDPDFDDIPMDMIMDMIRALPTGYRAVFNLYVFEKKSHKEIASILNIAENSSASQLHRAKNVLAKQIKEYRSVKNRVYE